MFFSAFLPPLRRVWVLRRSCLFVCLTFSKITRIKFSCNVNHGTGNRLSPFGWFSRLPAWSENFFGGFCYHCSAEVCALQMLQLITDIVCAWERCSWDFRVGSYRSTKADVSGCSELSSGRKGSLPVFQNHKNKLSASCCLPVLRFKCINTHQSLRSSLTQLFCYCRASSGLLNPRPSRLLFPLCSADLLSWLTGASPVSQNPNFLYHKNRKSRFISTYFLRHRAFLELQLFAGGLLQTISADREPQAW